MTHVLKVKASVGEDVKRQLKEKTEGCGEDSNFNGCSGISEKGRQRQGTGWKVPDLREESWPRALQPAALGSYHFENQVGKAGHVVDSVYRPMPEFI